MVGRRADGFHDLRTTFQEIDLHDLIQIAPAEKTTFTSDGFAIDPEKNTVRKALDAVGVHARIHVHKRIPPGSGMGGASSDAAATLKAVRTMFNIEAEIKPIAVELGSDVPFFMQGGRARGEGRGEKLTALPAENRWFAIAWPGFELSTAAVYRAWDEVKGDGPNHLRRAAAAVDARIDDFESELGHGWQMTGSGSAFFKTTETKREAEEAIKNLDCWTAVAASIATA